MKEEKVDKTFQCIRNLSPEIALTDIQKFILSQPLAIFTASKFSWLNFKNIIIMVTSGSIISILVMLNSGHPVNPAVTKTELIKEIKKQEISIEQPETKPVEVVTLLPQARVKNEMQPVKAKPVNLIEDSSSSPEELIAAPEALALPASSDQMEEEPISAPPSCNKPCNCSCNDADNVACTFKEKLMEDELITDNEKYSFKIDDKSLTVNGSTQPDNAFKKYSKVYKELTGRKLTEGSYISVSVEKGHCNISISTNGNK